MSGVSLSVGIYGNDLSAHCAKHFLRRAGIHDIEHYQSDAATPKAGLIIGSNISRLLRTIDEPGLNKISHAPDRDQVRLAQSGYLLTELPLGNFYADRYGAPLLNLEYDEVISLISDSNVTKDPSLDQKKRDVLIDTRRLATEASRYKLWQYRADLSESTNTRANVTWLGDDFIAWQYATRSREHFVWFAEELPSPTALHPALHPYLDTEDPADVGFANANETMYASTTVYLGSAISSPWPIQQTYDHLGVEDAWVLARMLENYEDEVTTALSEYEKYRLPRHRKITSYSTLHLERLLHKQGLKRVGRNLGIAFRSRFLPEMAMQQVDWLYQYDCIRGFR